MTMNKLKRRIRGLAKTAERIAETASISDAEIASDVAVALRHLEAFMSDSDSESDISMSDVELWREMGYSPGDLT